ncbi:MAG: DUF4349 domain-containing protein [Candidatus Dormibacteria bacterium]
MTQKIPLPDRITRHLGRVEKNTPNTEVALKILAKTTHEKRSPEGTRKPARRFFSPRLRTILSTAAALPAILVAVLVISMVTSPHQTNTVFSNISNGLNMGGGTASGGAGAASSNSGALTPSTSSKTANPSASINNVAAGTLPANQQRLVDVGFVIPQHAFTDAFTLLTNTTVSLGGYLVNSSTSANSHHAVSSGSLVLAVPVAKLPSFFMAIPKTYTTSYLNFNFKDYSGQVNSTQDNLAADQATLANDQKELAAATDPSTVQYLQQQITALQTKITAEQQSLGSIQQTVSYAMVTVSLTEQTVPTPKTPQLEQAFTRGIHNDEALLSVLIVFLLTAWPYLLVLGVIWYMTRSLRKRLWNAFVRDNSTPPPPNLP